MVPLYYIRKFDTYVTETMPDIWNFKRIRIIYSFIFDDFIREDPTTGSRANPYWDCRINHDDRWTRRRCPTRPALVLYFLRHVLHTKRDLVTRLEGDPVTDELFSGPPSDRWAVRSSPAPWFSLTNGTVGESRFMSVRPPVHVIMP